MNYNALPRGNTSSGNTKFSCGWSTDDIHALIHKHFADAPTEDLEGDSLVVRFNRKGNTHYLSAEKDNKKKKYFFVYEEGSWKEKKRD